MTQQRGLLHADLRVGANVTAALVPLCAPTLPLAQWASCWLARVSSSPAKKRLARQPAIIHPYRNGRGLAEPPCGVKLIDAFGLSADELRSWYPAVFQHLWERVKLERDHNNLLAFPFAVAIFAEPRKTSNT